MASYQDLQKGLYTTLTGQAGPARQGAYDYYNNILKAGPNWAAAGGPAYDAISKQYDTASRNLLNSSTAAGGGLTRGLTQLQSDKAFGIGQIIGGLQPLAANQLSAMSNQDYITALNALDAAQRQATADADRKERGLQALGGFAVDIAKGTGIFDKIKGAVLGGGPGGAARSSGLDFMNPDSAAGAFQGLFGGDAAQYTDAQNWLQNFVGQNGMPLPGIPGVGDVGTLGFPGTTPPFIGEGGAFGGAGGGSQFGQLGQLGSLVKGIPGMLGHGLGAVGSALGSGLGSIGGAIGSAAGGIGSALGSAGAFLATNPIGWAIGGGLGLGLLANHLLNPLHNTGNKFVHDPRGQNAFGAKLTDIAELGKTDPANAGKQLQAAWNDFYGLIGDWHDQGGQRQQIAKQALDPVKNKTLLDTVRTMAGQLGVKLNGLPG